MSDPVSFSIAEAKAQFAELVNQTQAGAPVRITRRGKAVAVLLSEAEYERLQTPRGSWVAFSKAWRQGMAHEDIAFLTDAELQGLRNTAERRATELG